MNQRLWVLMVGLSLTQAACVSFESAKLPEERFQLLKSGNLVGFEQRIATERQTGNVDDWTSVGEAWVSLAECESIDAQHTLNARPGLHHALVRFESLRLRDLVASGGWKMVRGTIFEDMIDPAHLTRVPAPIDAEIRWPHTDERWGDELPAQRDLTGSCDSILDSEEDIAAQLVAQAMVLLEKGSDLSQSEEYAVWRARVWAAYRAIQISKVEDHLWLERANRLLRDLEPSEQASAEENALALLLAASIADGPEQHKLALKSLQFFERDHSQQWYARYLAMRGWMEVRDWERAVAFADVLPPREHPVFTATIWRAALSARRASRPDVFLRLAMEAFRDRDRRADPFMDELYRQILAELSDYPFDARIAEMLEELGPRAMTYQRLEDFARVCLDRGRPENARAVATLLLAKNRDARSHPRYHGILALAAFFEDDVRRFRRHVQDIANRDSKVLSAIPTNRRATFFAGPDEEFSRILRMTLPLMVEWGDAQPSLKRRQLWLTAIVEEAQAFLRQAEESMARPQLVELYRVASALLAEHPRGYAERIGAQSEMLIIGTVVVEERSLKAYEPEIRVVLPSPYTVALLPEDTRPAEQWEPRWPRSTQ